MRKILIVGILRSEARVRSLSWPAPILGDLSDGAEMVGQVSDARDHPGELHFTDIAWGAQRRQPAMCFVTQAVLDRFPGGCVDVTRLPRLVPRRIRERIATLCRPSI